MEIHSLARNPLADTFNWIKKAVPNPNEQNISVQIGVHFEEVAEMLDQIGSQEGTTILLLENAQLALERLATHLKRDRPKLDIKNRLEFLDSICDQLVTATASAYMQKMDPIGGLIEVNESNYSKFVDGEPVFDQNRKITKGPNYRKPDLNKFV